MVDYGDAEDRPQEGNGKVWWIATAVVFLAAAGAAWWFWPSKTAPVVAEVPPPVAVVVPDPEQEPVEPEETSPGGVAESPDAKLKRLLGGSLDPAMSGWLSAPGMVQRLTAAVWLVSQGKSPRSVLSFVEITGDFEVIEEPREDTPIYIAPAAYARYDTVVRAITRIDPGLAAAAYRELRPHFTRAFKEVAQPNERFDDVLALAITRILEVKVPDGPVEVEVRGGVFDFVDPELQKLDPAQKHLLRLGPKHARAMQDFLRNFAQRARLPVGT